MPPMNLPAGLSDIDFRLGQLWHFHKLGYRAQGLLDEAAGVCHELIKAGFSEAELEAEITSDARKRTETTWEFEKRLRLLLLSRPQTSQDGEIDTRTEEWGKFTVAYIAEWPRFGGDYSFLADWRYQSPFDDATLTELMMCVRVVRANPKQAMSANKFALLSGAIYESRRQESARKTRVVETVESGRVIDDGRHDDEAESALLVQRHGFVKAAEILKRRKAKANA